VGLDKDKTGVKHFFMIKAHFIDKSTTLSLRNTMLRIVIFFILILPQSIIAFGPDKLFPGAGIPELTLEGKLFESWMERKKEKRQYHTANLKYEGKSISLKIKVRGNSRGGHYITSNGGKKINCPFPMLKMKVLSTEFKLKKLYFVSRVLSKAWPKKDFFIC
jgi:hypothetical protein